VKYERDGKNNRGSSCGQDASIVEQIHHEEERLVLDGDDTQPMPRGLINYSKQEEYDE
jgi:hypothetical protein